MCGVLRNFIVATFAELNRSHFGKDEDLFPLTPEVHP